MIKILFIADIVGRPGRRNVASLLAGLLDEKQVDFVIANGENAAGGLGLTPDVMDEITACGVDVITSGNHIWRRKEILQRISAPNLLRPANYPPPGSGERLGSI